MQPQQDNNYWQPESEQPVLQPVMSAPVMTNPAPPQEESLPDPDRPITWQASDAIHYDKDGRWFLALGAVAAVLLMVDIFLIRSWTFGALIVVMTIAAFVVARRPPQVLNYSLSPQGIMIDTKQFSFHDFRAFGVLQEGAFYSIRLIPNKRFMPLVSVYFPSEQGEQIVDVLGSMLPMENIEPDPIDKLMEKIRF